MTYEELDHPSCPRRLHTQNPAQAPARRHLTSMAKCFPLMLCSEPLFKSCDQCRCNCTAWYCAGRSPPVMKLSFPSIIFTGGHQSGQSPHTGLPVPTPAPTFTRP